MALAALAIVGGGLAKGVNVLGASASVALLWTVALIAVVGLGVAVQFAFARWTERKGK